MKKTLERFRRHFQKRDFWGALDRRSISYLKTNVKDRNYVIVDLSDIIKRCPICIPSEVQTGRDFY
ncbi:MAG: hypothetical protein KAW56_01585 [Candidatus Marinimicrobia bacterium]|nr:hypothetical protein [Candidatus Neomarinimicrobiota bacterium]